MMMFKPVHMQHRQLVLRVGPAPAFRFRGTRICTACRPQDKNPILASYTTNLNEEQQVDVVSKLVAAGFTDADQEVVVDLNNEDLEDIGIEPQIVRSTLLQAFTDLGPGKTIVLGDYCGDEVNLEFHNKFEFDRWIQVNTLTQGSNVFVSRWEDLKEGKRYYMY